MSAIDVQKLNIVIQDFMAYISLFEESSNSIQESEEKTIVQEWSFMILEHLHNDFDDARIRNLALSELLMDIQSNKLQTPFNDIPSCRAYGELIGWLRPY